MKFTNTANISKFNITSNTEVVALNVSDAGIIDFRYYESILSNTITNKSVDYRKSNSELNQGTLDGLPIRGGEKTHALSK